MIGERPISAAESVDDFRLRARVWLAANLPPLGDDGANRHQDEEDRLAQHRVLQRRLFEGGFAGLCFPREYGGQGLTTDHQLAFNEEATGYEMPSAFNVPTLGILAATLLDCGSEKQKKRHLPAILCGDEYWIQFLSEPSGGSDVAGALTTAVRDGDEWVLNGSKVWSTRAWQCDYAMCLARTNWDVPKHRGLTVFIVKIHQPGVDVHRVEMINGSREFCQEYFTDVRLGADSVVGRVDDGWTIVTRWLYNERLAVGGGSPYVSGTGGDGAHGPDLSLVRLAKRVGKTDDTRARDSFARAYADGVVQDQLIDRVMTGIKTGALPDPAVAIMRLFRGEICIQRTTDALDMAGEPAAIWAAEDADIGAVGVDFLMRQTAAIGGGTTEIARNVISERVLGMPREHVGDRDLAFKDVRTNRR